MGGMHPSEEYRRRLPHVALIGLARSGKDTVARLLMERIPEYRRVAWADPVREMALAIDPFVSTGSGFIRLSSLVQSNDWETAKQYPDVRRLLQRIGTDAVRAKDADFWVRLGMRTASTGPGGPCVFTDTRFPNEMRAVRFAGGVVVKVVRPGVEDLGVPFHTSEAFATSPLVSVDWTVPNDGDLQTLGSRVDLLADFLRSFHIIRPF